MLPSPLAIAAIAVFVAVIALPTHVFDKQELNAIGRQAIAGHNTSEAIVHAFIKGVQARWPDHTVSGAPEDLEWLWFNSGGAMGSFTILHASMSEYVVVLGSALRCGTWRLCRWLFFVAFCALYAFHSTQGHTGRFLADDSMTMLVGEAWTTAPGVTRKEVYGAGALFLLPFGHAHQYQMCVGAAASSVMFGFLGVAGCVNVCECVSECVCVSA